LLRALLSPGRRNYTFVPTLAVGDELEVLLDLSGPAPRDRVLRIWRQVRRDSSPLLERAVLALLQAGRTGMQSKQPVGGGGAAGRKLLLERRGLSGTLCLGVSGPA
jgi:hypothetical protein